MPYRFATEVENILHMLPLRPLIAMRIAAEDVHTALPDARKIAVVSDANTHAALGAQVEKMFSVRSVVLPGMPSPDMETVALLRHETAGTDALIAVGSGTINDLCKYASCLDGKPYIACPTAPSMNGYTSANASIIEHGKKETYAARLPKAVLCDMDVIADAPIRLIRAGLGDSMARSTAQADWLLSHYLQDTPYDERPFTLLAPYELALLASAEALSRSGGEAVAHLMKVLLLSGFGMTLAGGSYPASQGEHMIAHTYESLYDANGTYHGEQIGVTTLTMARLQESLIHTLPPVAQEKIRTVMLPSKHIESVLKAAGCPTTPQELGWDEAQYNEAVKQARFSRDRFTFLSLVGG